MVDSGFLWMSAIAQLSPLADLSGLLRDALAWIDGLGPMGAIAFIGLYIVATVAFLPGSVLTLGAGVVFGLLAGTLYVLVGATLGAIAAFWVGRYLARDWVARKIAQNPRFRAIDEAIGREGLKIVILTRLSPVFPFNLLNYSLGLTQVSLRDYCLGFVGMIPGTLLYVYLGSLAGSLATLGSGETPGNPALEWTLRIVGFLATLGVTLYITRLARQALQTKISETPDA
ncbi:SNARE associated Golgi protein-like protein [Geitlerinema sp. PCC 7407]|nr:SNARE associated Golgi protein-like protein [Geitlerinema sp. PCC 7407]